MDRNTNIGFGRRSKSSENEFSQRAEKDQDWRYAKQKGYNRNEQFRGSESLRDSEYKGLGGRRDNRNYSSRRRDYGKSPRRREYQDSRSNNRYISRRHERESQPQSKNSKNDERESNFFKPKLPSSSTPVNESELKYQSILDKHVHDDTSKGTTDNAKIEISSKSDVPIRTIIPTWNNEFRKVFQSDIRIQTALAQAHQRFSKRLLRTGENKQRKYSLWQQKYSIEIDELKNITTSILKRYKAPINKDIEFEDFTKFAYDNSIITIPDNNEFEHYTEEEIYSSDSLSDSFSEDEYFSGEDDDFSD